jgi:hypothetical protein
VRAEYWPTMITLYYVRLYEHGLATSGFYAKDVVDKRIKKKVKTPVPDDIYFV